MGKIAFLEGQVEYLKTRIKQYADVYTEDFTKDNIIVSTTPYYRKCWNYLVERERKHLGVGEELTKATFINYIMGVVFIEGNKFSINSIPDRVLNKFKEDILIYNLLSAKIV